VVGSVMIDSAMLTKLRNLLANAARALEHVPPDSPRRRLSLPALKLPELDDQTEANYDAPRVVIK
jgi:hypothetical protein